MIAAIHHGARAPAWVTVLQACEVWGCPPWIVRGQEPTPVTRLRWLTRWRLFTEQVFLKRKLETPDG